MFAVAKGNYFFEYGAVRRGELAGGWKGEFNDVGGCFYEWRGAFKQKQERVVFGNIFRIGHLLTLSQFISQLRINSYYRF